jgi:hypothetical protein
MSQYEGDQRNRQGQDFSIQRIIQDGNPLIQKDPELLSLDEQLRRTAPRPEAAPSPKFKKKLEKKLQKIVRKHRPKHGRP